MTRWAPVCGASEGQHPNPIWYQSVTVGTFPAEAPSRAQYRPQLRALVVYLVQQQLVPYSRVRELLADLFGASLFTGLPLYPAFA